jgi:hypothetical protein
VGVFETHGGEKCVMWRLLDNTSIPLTKQQLTATLEETQKQKALRTSRLYAKRRQFKDNGGTYSEVFRNGWLDPT